MGNGTHPEKISPGSFDDKFKNLMRDYYQYGFQTGADYDYRKEDTHREDWNRLNRLIHSYFQWSEDYGKYSVLFASCDSQTMEINPFHHLYRFCRYTQRDPQIFFNILFALSDKIRLRGWAEWGDVDRWGNPLRELQSFLLATGSSLDTELGRRNLFRYLPDIENGTFDAASIPDKYNIDKKEKRLLLFINSVYQFVHSHNNCQIISSKDDPPHRTLIGIRRAGAGADSIPITRDEEEEYTRSILRYKGSLDQYRENIVKETIYEKLTEGVKNLSVSITHKDGLTRSQLQCFVPNDKSLFVGKNEALKEPLRKMEQLHLIRNNASAAPGQRVYENRYALQTLTLKEIIEAGTTYHPDFQSHLRDALTFFSRHTVFGECGIFLLDRFEDKNTGPSPFRFKHDYLMHALNDFTRKDLLDAIEQKRWIRVEYRKSVGDDVRTELLCRPLEIRSSVTSGREFLVFYEPFHRSYTGLRLEFIDGVYYYDDTEVKNVLFRCLGRRSQDIDRDILNARLSILYAWGISSTPDQEGNAIFPVVPTDVHLCMRYDPSSEYYIRNRIHRESRIDNRKRYIESNRDLFTKDFLNRTLYDIKNRVTEKDGFLTLDIQVSDPNEIKPWIRSFYCRITEYSETPHNLLERDVQNMDHRPRESWGITEKVRKCLGDGTAARGHEMIFHEMFGVYYHMIAEFLTKIIKAFPGSLSQRDLDKLSGEIVLKETNHTGEYTGALIPQELDELCVSGAFGKYDNAAHFISKYEPEKNMIPSSLYKDLIPLTEMELRWLKTIIHDSRFHSFFVEDGEIDALHALLQQETNITALPMQKLVWYDRYRISKHNLNNENSVLRPLLDSIENRKCVRITFLSRYKRERNGIYSPIVIEYSCRNNYMQVYAQEKDSSKITLINLSRIQKIICTELAYDYEEAFRAYHKYRNRNKRSIEILFFNKKNLVDRILTEFAPWEKRCTFVKSTDTFHLRLFYQSIDETEVMVRLMGYGPEIIFADPECRPAKDIQERINRQTEIIKDNRRTHIRLVQDKDDPELIRT